MTSSRRRSERLGTWLRLISYLRRGRAELVFLILLSLLLGGLQLAAPLLLGRLLDSMLPGKELNYKLLFALAGCYAGSFALGLLQGREVAKVSFRTAGILRDEAFARLTKLPMQFFDRAKHGDIINRLTSDVQFVSEALQQIFTQLFSGLVILFGSLFFMMYLNAGIALVVLLLTPLTFFITSIIARSSHRLFLEQSVLMGSLQAHAEEMLEGQKLLRAYAAEERSQEIFDAGNAKLYKVGQKAQFASSLTNPGTRFVNNITYVLVGVFASALAAQGKLSIGDISAFLSFALQFAKPVNEITAVMTQVQQGLASAERIFELLDQPEEDPETAKPELELERGAVSFKNVSFSYDPAKPLIRNFSREIAAGKTVAIVGPTGAGKTTLVNLLMRFYDADAGAIFLDGQNIYDCRRESVRAVYGMVLQETWLFSGTIYDNIAYGKEGASEQEVIAAAKAAHAHHFIMQMEEGYQTKLEDAGESLSAGQKQLLTIARVMLSDPALLILDEATSDIDTRTEILVQESFLRLMEGRTSFIIAHRLSTIRQADLILVMDKGQIIETGTHQELVEAGGFYADLYRSQFA